MPHPTLSYTSLRSTLPKWLAAFGLASCMSCTSPTSTAQDQSDQSDATLVLGPGDSRFDLPDFSSFIADYSSASSATGAFTLEARKTGDGKRLVLIDIIPMDSNVIVSQRHIDLASLGAQFSAMPYFAWGTEFVVAQADTATHDWVRIPIGGGEPTRTVGDIEHGGYVDEMFSPTLAAAMPLPIGTKFQLPEAVPFADGHVESRLVDYEVIAHSKLELDNGLECECWLIEKRSNNDRIEHIWVSRKSPFVFRRIRNVGTEREFTSDLLDFRTLED